jgi:cyclopropane fatty-acyl-phospholipid synthase-like methyltransferase
LDVSKDQDEILDRYRKVYGLGTEITFEHVVFHERLERSLTETLLSSNPDNRWQVFEDAYTTLYTNLPWLNQQVTESAGTSPRVISWKYLIPPGSNVYEIGSGKAELLRYLCSLGCECTATEITRERGEHHLAETDGLKWQISDGVNLTNFEQPGQFDYVVSTQVVEHIHPDDFLTHLCQVRQLLRDGGSYIFDTPHSSCGPHDLSQVFNFDRARYMHLHEYDWIEMKNLLNLAGYSKIEAILNIPGLSSRGFIKGSELYFKYLLAVDWLEKCIIANSATRRRLRKILRAFLVPSNIWISAKK